ncbi:hypothetical protein K474DRAFT_1667378 [Panus rudis PR-1116 ss-1]|nr:hypothetical protein K474DRAFT_1667378 [Panus rudis PR-1116 ss-1]
MDNSQCDLATQVTELSAAAYNTLRRLLRCRLVAEKERLQNLSEIEDWYKAYLDLRWASKDVAGDIRAAAIDFAGPVLHLVEDEHVEIELKVDILRGWIERLQEKVEYAQNLPGEFNKLAKGLKELAQTIRADNEPQPLQVSFHRLVWNHLASWTRTVRRTSPQFVPFRRASSQVARSSGVAPQTSGINRLRSIVHEQIVYHRFTRYLTGILVALRQSVTSPSSLYRPIPYPGPSNPAVVKDVADDLEAIANDVQALVPKLSVFDQTYARLLQEVSTVEPLMHDYADPSDGAFRDQIQAIRTQLEAYAALMERYQKSL